MRSWSRAIVSVRCGKCGTLLPEGALVQTIRLRGVKRPLCRCALCAEGEAPPDLPFVEPGRLTKRMQKLETPAWLKARAGR